MLILPNLLTYYRHPLLIKGGNSCFESSRYLKAACKYLKIILQYGSDTWKYRLGQTECNVLSQVVSCYGILVNFRGP